MCGIAGFLGANGRDRNASAAIGHAMHLAIAHRGPDSAAIWQDEKAPLVFAHRRLAIHDLSSDGAQPMASPSGRYMIVYNGELYNYRELQSELEALGQVFKTRCDTEILLAAIDRWGLNQALQKFNGMFAIALWDVAEQKLHFIRDRFGKKPLYVGWAGDALVFASELKSFHAHPDFIRDVNRESLAMYMRFGYLCAPYAIFKNVWQLLPAGRLTIDANALQPGADLSRQMELYWSLRHAVDDARAHPIQDSEENILADFESRLALAVRQRMDCDVPFGSFLSGGIDSSLVTAMMQAHSPRPVQTYSIGFDDEAYDESKHAASIAAHLGTDHREFRVSARDAIDVIPMMADIYDEPFADASQIPTYLISRLARKHVSVALTGDGGDELMGGYDRHTQLPALWSKVGWLPASLRKMMASVALSIPQKSFDALRPDYPQFGRRVHRFAQSLSAKNANALYASLLQLWPENEQIVPGATSPSAPFEDASLLPNNLSLAEKLIYADLLSYRPNDLMVKADRATMAVALEARAPLMDYALCEYSWRIPMDLKIRDREGKYLLRRLLDKYVPRHLTDRPKAGFNAPIHQWLKGPLKSWGDDLLSLDRLKKQGIVNAEIIHARWTDFQAGRGGHANATDIWTALMFQSWHDRWIEKG